jgi:hypothetical protein
MFMRLELPTGEPMTAFAFLDVMQYLSNKLQKTNFKLP